MDGKTCQPIKVFARLRPLKQNKKVLTQSVTHKDVSLSLNENFLLVDHKDQYLKVKFDKVFGENETQLDVFSHVQDMADDLINGTSCGILAYGQTGSGTEKLTRQDVFDVWACSDTQAACPL